MYVYMFMPPPNTIERTRPQTLVHLPVGFVLYVQSVRPYHYYRLNHQSLIIPPPPPPRVAGANNVVGLGLQGCDIGPGGSEI